MPKYHFNFRDKRGLSFDQDGINFDNVEEAYLEAFKAAQQMWLEMLLERKDPMICRFEITSATGVILIVLPFSEILEVCQAGPKNKPARQNDYSNSSVNIDRAKRLRAEFSRELALTRTTIGATLELMDRSAAS